MHKVVKSTTWHPAKLHDVQYHAACTKPDKHSAEDYGRLKESIGEHGIQEPIKVQLSSSAVVLGRHRIRAAKELGVPIPVDFIDISDSEAWGLSRSSLAHRNLSATRAAVLYQEMKDEEEKAKKKEEAANAKAAADAGGESEGVEKKGKKAKKAKPEKERKRAKKGEGKKSVKAAKESGTSPATIERVKRVREKGIPAVWKMMDADEVSANDAAFIVDFDKEIQKSAANLVKNGEARTLKAAKELLDKKAKEDGALLKDGKGKDVPKGLTGVFAKREDFVKALEFVKEARRGYKHLTEVVAGKYLPKEVLTHLEDAEKALDLFQPFAVAENEDGWLTKKESLGK